MNHEILTSVFI